MYYSAKIRFFALGGIKWVQICYASLGAVVLPCTFTGTVTVAGEGYAAGHAYKAKKIYEETLSLFQ